MTQIISAETVKNSGLSFDNVKSYASATGLLAAGMLVAHNALKLVKMQDSILANGALCVASFGAAMMVKNPLAKLGLLGITVFTGLKTIALAAKEVTAPGNTGANGLSGLVPESIKPKIQAIFPSFGNVEASYDNIGSYEDVGEINLDDNVNGAEENLLGEEDFEGVGNVSAKMI